MSQQQQGGFCKPVWWPCASTRCESDQGPHLSAEWRVRIAEQIGSFIAHLEFRNPHSNQDRGVISSISPCDGPRENPGFLTNLNALSAGSRGLVVRRCEQLRDCFEQVAHGGNRFPLFVGNGKLEALFHGHGDFNDRERICSKVFLDLCPGNQLRPLNSQLFDEDVEDHLGVFIR